MIRTFTTADMEPVLNIWLAASLKAHDFIPADFWQSQVENMRTLYLPASAVYVYEDEETVKGFYALYDNQLAAIFVTPEAQGKGIGKTLLNHAKMQREMLSLNVYQRNQASYQFYLSQGFEVTAESTDEHTGEAEWVMAFSVS
ncbi:N-acetyltransferase [Photobacterium galatheae]|uniref:GCN5 family acetyltransferase n=1 Tax=Photobacterium galatheae TaxID=1654360 RepID=A0A066RL82_9GAMM|nr:N-acetyltransferase [Photobacterium galatheae]KDM89886.1 GCN5 family acetyltransferase [Photobacterium galatheae]MCM0151180.1 N-acetyltransferase [Photobacterium galatheae]